MTRPLSDPVEPRGFFKSGEPWAESQVTRDAAIDKTHPRCLVCQHERRHQIEALSTGGASLMELATRFGMSKDSIHRHMQAHVSTATKIGYLAGPAKLNDLANLAADENKSLLEYLSILRSILFGALDRSARRDRAYEQVHLSRSILDVLREIGRMTGEISAFTSQTLNITQNRTVILNSPGFLELEAGLFQICAAHPEARADIIALFRDLDAKHAPAGGAVCHGWQDDRAPTDAGGRMSEPSIYGRLAETLADDWTAPARKEQLPPAGEWNIWLILSGRGWGRTRTGSEWIKSLIIGGKAKRVAIVGSTAGDLRDVMIEGPAGILSVCSD